MRIDGINRVYDAYQVQSTAQVKKQNQVAGKDEVAFSSEAKDYAEIKRLLSDVPDVRQNKIEALKEKMNSGTYNVEAEEVAEKMLTRLDIRG